MGAESADRENFSVRIEQLRELLSGYGRVAVAFSGGIDSTVLLHNCCVVLAPEQVIACHVKSRFMSERAMGLAEKILSFHFTKKCRVNRLTFDPFAVNEVVENNKNRCYLCKRQIYTLIRSSLDGDDWICVDGSNLDDLSEYRPGLQAIKEMDIKTPMVDVGLTKNEIRRYGIAEGLINADEPSESCLATRIVTGKRVTTELLTAVEKAELVLSRDGFRGHRVKIDKNKVEIVLTEPDWGMIAKQSVRCNILRGLADIGIENPVVRLVSR